MISRDAVTPGQRTERDGWLQSGSLWAELQFVHTAGCRQPLVGMWEGVFRE